MPICCEETCMSARFSVGKMANRIPGTFESTLVPAVHVIGDACIADAMPKSASAAYSQAQQCAGAIASLLSGRDAPEPVFDSVCYSMLSPDSALSIPGRFATTPCPLCRSFPAAR